MRLLDLFCGRWGWSRAFAARGWECIGVDLVEPADIPDKCKFVQADILALDLGHSSLRWIGTWEVIESFFDFIVASSPCEEFSVHGMKHFHPNPKYPDTGIRLFNHTRRLCELSNLPYVMENVRTAQQFVGPAVHHCGPFYLWGNAVPPLMNQGINKGGAKKYWSAKSNKWRDYYTRRPWETAERATIPIELANCVADYAERLLEQKLIPPASRQKG